MRISKYELMLKESKRFQWNGQNKQTFRGSEDVYRFITDDELFNLSSRPEEHLLTFALNVKGELIGFTETSIGELSSTALSPRQILMFAIQCNAGGLIICHNHPSGDPTPSNDDISATRRLKEACKLVGIQLVDHIVVGNGCYTSLAMEGVL